MGHQAVLLQEVVEALAARSGQFVVDGTVGVGGHAKELLKKIGKSGRLLGLDRDPEAVTSLKETFQSKQVTLVTDRYSRLPVILQSLGLPAPDAILLDLGLSSNQLEDSRRGFSFRGEGPLDMRFDQSQSLTAQEIISKWSVDQLADIFRRYGEEPLAKTIAQAVVKERPIGAKALAELVERIYRRRYRRSSQTPPPTKVFQALRIAVNDELKEVEVGLRSSFKALAEAGRLAVITFHSLEDRLVKNYFRELTTGQPDPVTGRRSPLAKNLTPKPIVPGKAELTINPRGHSAKLRAIQKN